MASWESTKMEAQSVNNIAGNFYQDVHGSARNVDLDTLMNDRQYRDHILNYDATKSTYEPTPEDWKDYERHLDESSRGYPEQELQEPEM